MATNDIPEKPAIPKSRGLYQFIPLFICLLMVAATLLVTLALGTAKRNEQLKEERLQTLNSLTSSRARLQSEIYARFLLAQSVVGFVENNPNVIDQDFTLLARDTLRVDSVILGVRIARGQEVRFVYPESGRLDLMGEQLRNTVPAPEQRQLRRIITESLPHLGGPVIGPDNRKIFLLMIPIYQKIVGLPGTGPYWGMSVFELDVNILLQEAGIEQTGIAVRLLGDQANVVLKGGTHQFGEKAITEKLEAVWGTMELAVTPPPLPPGSKVIWMLGLGVALMLGAASWLTAHQVIQRIRTQEQYRELVQNARSIILRVTPSGTISFFNEYASEFFGFSQPEVLGKHLLQTILPPQDEQGRDTAALVMEMLSNPDQHAFTEQRNIKKSGQEAWVSWAIRPMYDEAGRISEILLAGTDISARKQLEAKLRDLATTDALTGVPNRRHFLELAETEISRAQRYQRPASLLLLDIDHFKAVNDGYGHDIGDLALKGVVSEISRILRDQDVCGRLGGEEFGVLLPETTEEQALHAAERVRAGIEAASVPLAGGGELRLTISVGVAALEADTPDLDTLLKRADVALYEAKRNGRNRTERG